MLDGIYYLAFVCNVCVALAARKNFELPMLAAVVTVLVLNLALVTACLVNFHITYFEWLLIPFYASVIMVYIEGIKAVVKFQREEAICRAIFNWRIPERRARRIGNINHYYC